MEMSITDHDNGVKEVTLNGRMDMKGTLQVDDKFAFNTTGAKYKVLVNLDNVDFIASIGMRMLISAAKAQDQRGGKLVLLNAKDMVADVLKSGGVDQIIPMYDDRDAAVAALTG